MRIKNPKQRLKKFTDTCKTKTVCPSSGGGRYKLNPVQLTHRLKAPGCNP
jgi:DNA-directed RNA polymerase II subunit RPB1